MDHISPVCFCLLQKSFILRPRHRHLFDAFNVDSFLVLFVFVILISFGLLVLYLLVGPAFSAFKRRKDAKAQRGVAMEIVGAIVASRT